MKYSKHGYKRNSKDRNNPYNVIPSGNITMEGVDFPVMGTDNLGNQKLMMPGANYTFPGNEVFEVPLAQNGGSTVDPGQLYNNQSEFKSNNNLLFPEVSTEENPIYNDRNLGALIYYTPEAKDSDTGFFTSDLERMIPYLNKTYGEGNWKSVELPTQAYNPRYTELKDLIETHPSTLEHRKTRNRLRGENNILLEPLFEQIEALQKKMTKSNEENDDEEFKRLDAKMHKLQKELTKKDEEYSKRREEYEDNYYKSLETEHPDLFEARNELIADYRGKNSNNKYVPAVDLANKYFSDIKQLKSDGNIFVMQHSDSRIGPLTMAESYRTEDMRSPEIVDTFGEILLPESQGGWLSDNNSVVCYGGMCTGSEGFKRITEASGITTHSQPGTWSGYQPSFGDDITEQYFNTNEEGIINPNFDGGAYITHVLNDGNVKSDTIGVFSPKNIDVQEANNVTGTTATSAVDEEALQEAMANDLSTRRDEQFYERQYGAELPKAQNGKESKKEKKARLEQERLYSIQKQKNQGIAEDFSLDNVEINTEGLRNPLIDPQHPIVSEHMQESNSFYDAVVSEFNSSINPTKALIEYFEELKDPTSLISRRLSGEFSDNAKNNKITNADPTIPNQKLYDNKTYNFNTRKWEEDFELGDFTDLKVNPTTVLETTIPRLSNYTFLDNDDYDKTGTRLIAELTQLRQDWVDAGNDINDFDPMAPFSFGQLQNMAKTTGPHVNAPAPFYETEEDYFDMKLRKSGEDPNDPRYENLKAILTMPQPAHDIMMSDRPGDTWLQTLFHELGHITGRDKFMGERDRTILADLNIGNLNEDEMRGAGNEGMAEGHYTIGHHMHKNTTHEAYADLTAVRLDMLEKGIYDFRNEQMTKEHWDTYLKSYDTDMKLSNKAYPLSLQRMLYRYRVPENKLKYFIQDEKNTGNDQDSNIRFINNSVADANEIGDDIDNSMMAKYGTELPSYQSQGEIPMTLLDEVTLTDKQRGVLPWIKRAGRNIWSGVKQTGSHALDILSVPGNLMAEGFEEIGGYGDGKFNFSDAMPGFSGDFSFTNMYDEPTKTVADVTNVQGFVPSLLVNVFTDPTSYIGVGLLGKAGTVTKGVSKTSKVINATDNLAIASRNTPTNITKPAAQTVHTPGSVHDYLTKYWNDTKFQKYQTTEMVRNARQYNDDMMMRNLYFKQRQDGVDLALKYGHDHPIVQNYHKQFVDPYPTFNSFYDNFKPTFNDKINYRSSFNDIINRRTKFGNQKIDFLNQKFKPRTFDELMDPKLLDRNYFNLLFDKMRNNTGENSLKTFKSWIKDNNKTLGLYYSPFNSGRLSDKIYIKDMLTSPRLLTARIKNPTAYSDQLKSTKIHEWSHFLDKSGTTFSNKQLDDLSRLADPFTRMKINDEKLYGSKLAKDYFYYTKPTEIKARMMELRNNFNLLPSDKFTMEHLKKSGNMFGMRPYISVDDRPELFLDIMNKYYREGGEKDVDFDQLERGIRYAESLNGELMKNPKSSASGLYQQLFDEIEYEGTRDQFIEDIDYQKELFKKRAYGEMKDVPGLISNGMDLYSEYQDQLDLTKYGLNPLTIAGLSNMLGRQGTRKYIGNVLRDGKTIEEIFPHLYGEDAKYPNHTPEEYITKFNKGLITKKEGGSTLKKIRRIKQQLNKYKEGKEISYIAKKELINLGLIDNALTSNKSVR